MNTIIQGANSKATKDLQLGTAVQNNKSIASTLLGAKLTDYFALHRDDPITLPSTSFQGTAGTSTALSDTNKSLFQSFVPEGSPQDTITPPSTQPEFPWATRAVPENNKINAEPLDDAQELIPGSGAGLTSSSLEIESFGSSLPTALLGLGVGAVNSAITSNQTSSEIQMAKIGTGPEGHAFDALNHAEANATNQTFNANIQSALIAGGSLFGPEGLGVGLLAAGVEGLVNPSTAPSVQVNSTSGMSTTANDL